MVRLFISILTCILAVYAAVASAGENEKPKKIVLVAGTKSHGPGHHEYELGMRVIKHCLDTSANAPAVKTEVHLHGWPTDESTLDDADTIVLFCDGSDHDVKAHPILHGDRLKMLDKQMKRGCGLVAIHYTVFVPTERGGPEFLEWIGGFFDYQTGKTPNHWYSKIQNADTRAVPASPDHPISRGLTPFQLSEEYYYNIRFRDGDPRRVPILNAPIPGEPNQQTVAWTVERADGGRGFGFTGGHYHSNWAVENYRRMILNAVLWTAKAEVPAAGIQSELPSAQPKPADDAKRDAAKVLIVTGHQYPGHPWRETTKSIERSLATDKRFAVDVIVDPEFLAKDELQKYQTIILNYCNWERRGLSEESKRNFVEYLSKGGGLVIVHFANGAFHFSLPKAGESDWPEFRKICRRVWDHTQGKSAHDAYGKFRVDISTTRHPITLGMQSYETTDELYFAQQGDEPIEVLATGRSKITGRDEPLAFVYEYGKGRVFQTLLGHDAASLDARGTAAFVRRATAWTAGLSLAPEAPLTADALKKPSLTEGRFGKALDASVTSLTVPHKPEYKSLPLTVECWAKISGKDRFNVIVASAPKESADHWELYSYVGAGDFSVYLPGYTPAEVRSGVEIADDRWHYLALTLDGKKAALYVDGKLAKETVVQRIRQAGPDGPLWIGGYPPGGIGCNGRIDEVRISKSMRTIDTTPGQPLSPDGATVGLWHFDAVDNQGHSPDDSSLMNAAAVGAMSQSANGAGSAKPGEPKNHFGREVVGFDWTEDDSRDDRWNKTDVGQFLSASFPSPTGAVLKGLAVRIGENDDAAVCYDTGQLSFRAAWRGKFLKFDPARFGLIAPPRFAADIELLGANEPAWPARSARYLGLHTHGKRTVLAYEVKGCRVLESPWTESVTGAQAYTREFEIAASTDPLRILICLAPGTLNEFDSEGQRFTTVEEKNRVIAATVRGHPAKIVYADGRLFLDISPRRQTARIKLFTWTGDKDHIAEFATLARKSPAPLDLSTLAQPGIRRWTHDLVTRGQRSADDKPLVVDTLTLPFENPYRALLFTSGHDFFANGDAAVCTVHGDVWTVGGIDDRLEKLTWRRFATGLYQPLGLRIVNDQVYVVGRDQITRLHDRNSDGEADYYECFSNLAKTSAEGHDYSACLETDRDGNFLFISAAQGVVRITPDGRKLETLADGLRNPNGLAVSPTGIITVSPQEGNWTPASSIIEIQPGGYYGFGGPRASPDRPLGYDPPLCWIPRHIDNSSGGQVWVTSGAWNPLLGQLLHFSYGRCTMLLTLRETIDSRAQGAVVALPVQFDSGVMRGRFHPRDGQLYVTGLKGWVSSAAQDGCFQRVRYTGGPLYLPTGIQTLANGIKLSFSEPLDPLSAGDPDNYFVEQWNYHWTADYGSADFKASDPKQEGD